MDPDHGESTPSDRTSDRQTRNLKAIFFADVAGYTRLMGENEAATHRRIDELVTDFENLCGESGGELLEVRGDGIFAIFHSAAEAVRTGIEFQDRVEAKNQELSQNLRVRFRIGINLGDVHVSERGFFGDSVNIASRLESLADPGQVCISRAVYEAIRNKLDYGYEYLGPQRLKNVRHNVDAYFVHKDAQETVMAPSVRAHILSESAAEYAALERASLVILPFQNMSDPSEDYFADGISEDITTNLSKFHNLFVIARGSAFTYKGRAASVRQVGAELGVRYVTEGSIRKAGNRIRISAQLIDAESGQTLWGEHYDRDLDDVFAVQDEITEYIVSATAVQIEAAERERMRQIPPSDMVAYGLVLQGQQRIFRYTRNDNLEARRMYEEAYRTDPKYARAVAAISRTLNIDWRYSWADSPDDVLDRALELAHESVALDNTDARGHSELGFVYLYRKEHELAISAYERALALNPNDADVMSDMADALAHSGRSEQAIELLSKAMLLNPFYPDQYLWHLGGAYFNLKRYDEAIQTLLRMNNPAEGRRLLAASYAQLGRIREAREQAAMVLAAHPDFSLRSWARVQPDKYAEDVEHFVEGLKKAGL